MLKPLSQLTDNAKDEEPIVPAGDAEPAAPADDDPMAEVAKAIVEQAPPSIHEVPAEAAPAEEAWKDETSKTVDAAKEAEATQNAAPLDKEMDELLAEIAEREGISIDEARKMVERGPTHTGLRSAAFAGKQDDDHGKDRTENAAHQVRYAGGGQTTAVGAAVGALTSGIGTMVTSTGKKVASYFDRERRRTVNKQNMFRQWQDTFDDKVEAFYDAGDRIRDAVADFNKAFLSTEAASRLRKMAEDNGKSVTDFLAELRDGKGDPEALAAAKEAASSPAATEAYGRIEAAIADGKAALKEADRAQRKLLRNFPYHVDQAAMNGKLESALEEFGKNMPEPHFKPSEDSADKARKAKEEEKKFMEHIREMTETLQKMIERLLAKLGLAPKA